MSFSERILKNYSLMARDFAITHFFVKKGEADVSYADIDTFIDLL